MKFIGTIIYEMPEYGKVDFFFLGICLLKKGISSKPRLVEYLQLLLGIILLLFLFKILKSSIFKHYIFGVF